MPDIKLYDYQKILHPRVKEVVNYFVPDKKISLGLRPTAPWMDGNMFCCYYDASGELIGVRFVHRDGKYVDLIQVEEREDEKNKTGRELRIGASVTHDRATSTTSGDTA
jgi:hypothetical protein